MKRILFFGIFNPEYARTRILTEGFTALGYEVVLCNVSPRALPGARKYWVLFQQGRSLRHTHFDHVFVLFPGHTVVWLARILFGNRIIFDAFVSLFDSNVHDRALYSVHTFRSYYDRFLDWFSCALAHKVLVDTNTHRHYFIEHIGVPEKRLITMPVGAAGAWFMAGDQLQIQEHTAKPLLVEFYGSYIPLHGVPVIVRAAHILAEENIQFRLIGSGQEYIAVRLLAKKLGDIPNIKFLNAMSREKLIENMCEADICLGIFGTTKKASRVVPNKVYECAALGKPIITADTQGIREVFTDQENIFLVPPSSAQALAQAIRTLATDAILRDRLGTAVRRQMQKHYTPEHIVKQLLNSLS